MARDKLQERWYYRYSTVKPVFLRAKNQSYLRSHHQEVDDMRTCDDDKKKYDSDGHIVFDFDDCLNDNSTQCLTIGTDEGQNQRSQLIGSTTFSG